MSHPYEEAGRRIKAAVISYIMDYKWVDRTLKEMRDEDPGDGWSNLAEKLVKDVRLGVQHGVLRSEREPDEDANRRHSDETVQ